MSNIDDDELRDEPQYMPFSEVLIAEIETKIRAAVFAILVEGDFRRAGRLDRATGIDDTAQRLRALAAALAGWSRYVEGVARRHDAAADHQPSARWEVWGGY